MPHRIQEQDSSSSLVRERTRKMKRKNANCRYPAHVLDKNGTSGKKNRHLSCDILGISNCPLEWVRFLASLLHELRCFKLNQKSRELPRKVDHVSMTIRKQHNFRQTQDPTRILQPHSCASKASLQTSSAISFSLLGIQIYSTRPSSLTLSSRFEASLMRS